MRKILICSATALIALCGINSNAQEATSSRVAKMKIEVAPETNSKDVVIDTNEQKPAENIVTEAAKAEPITLPPPAEPIAKPQILEGYAGNFIAAVKGSAIAAEPANLASKALIAKSIEDSTAYTRLEAISGAKSIAIFSAAMTPDFIDGVKLIYEFSGEAAFISTMRDNPSKVKNIKGFATAQKNAALAVQEYLNIMDKNAKDIEDSSYSIQSQKWAKEKAVAAELVNSTSINWDKPAIKSDFKIEDIKLAQSSDLIIGEKTMAAAALYSVGLEEQAVYLLNKNEDTQCAYSAFLDLRMCLAATGFPYEHSFCLGKHALASFNQCVRKGLSR